MDPSTVELLRQAAIDALQVKNDLAASELLSLMDLRQPPNLPALPAQLEQPVQLEQLQVATSEFPSLPSSNEGRDYHFWAHAVEKYYLPVLAKGNKTEFTSPELFAWVDYSGFPLTMGDQELVGNRPQWKCRMGKALDKLCHERIIHRCGTFSKTYKTIVPQAALLGAL